jgi:hypothetical protein
MPRWLKVLLAVLAALAVALIVTKLPDRSRNDAFPSPPADPVRVEVAGPQGRIVLEKWETGWRLREPVDYPANEESVEELLNGLRKLSVGNAVTHREETHHLYHLTESSAVAVRVWGGGKEEAAAWLIGKNSPEFTHVYLRFPGRPDVYLARGLMRHSVEKDAAHWRDHRVFRLDDEEEIVRLSVQKAGSSYTLEKSSVAWTVGGKNADEQKVRDLLFNVRSFRADAFVDPPESDDLRSLGLAAPRDRLALATRSGKSVTLSIGHKRSTENRLAVRRDEEPVLLWISDYHWDQIPAKPAELLP